MAFPFLKGLRKRPSDAARWTRCAKALQFTKDYPNDSSEAADEGTAAHTIREDCLRFGFDPFDFIGRKIKVNGLLYECDEDMCEALTPGIDEIRSFGGEMFVEYWVDTTEWVGPDENGNPQGGTVDCAVVGKHLTVLSDLKFGRGVAVSPVKNDQQMLYALAFYHQVVKRVSPECTDFVIIIDQPRNSAGGGSWAVTLEQLEAYGRFVKERAAACEDPDATFTPSKDSCKWCPAANVDNRPGGCPAHAQQMMDDVEISFDDLDNLDLIGWAPPNVDALTPSRLIALSKVKGQINQFLEYAHARALQHLMDYGPAGGQKAVKGRHPRRKWRDPNAAEAYLKQTLPADDPYNKTLKTPTQAESILGKGKEIPTALVERGEPKPIMVPVEDSRPAIQSVESEFDEEA